MPGILSELTVRIRAFHRKGKAWRKDQEQGGQGEKSWCCSTDNDNGNISSTVYVPGSVLSAFHELFHFIIQYLIRDRYSYFSNCCWELKVQCWRNLFMIRSQSVSEVAQSYPTLCNPINCSLPGSSIHGIFQARVLEWVAISFSRGSSQPRDQTQVSHIAGRHFTIWATRVSLYGQSWDTTLSHYIIFQENWSTGCGSINPKWDGLLAIKWGM